jgi:hypothetical protein
MPFFSSQTFQDKMSRLLRVEIYPLAENIEKEGRKVVR